MYLHHCIVIHIYSSGCIDQFNLLYSCTEQEEKTYVNIWLKFKAVSGPIKKANKLRNVGESW